ncbi:hypothetical protein EPUL_000092 [Erysiphe pulchra]|uniref:CCHC-type domain-containing protein n=1 Tax=Erysiphe pulchra TaxID=225359 RepID=A0A2S4Q221_9PEZI|nr:hypothetical protein EPUL_000092 [Erysiphe pulchra]
MNGSQHSQDRRNASNPPPVCFNCGVPGHFVVACPQPSREMPAGIGVAHAQGLKSQNRQVHLQHRNFPLHQQTIYPNQLCGASIEPTSHPTYNAPSSPVLSHHQPAFQSNYYLAPQLNGPQYLSSSSYASQNYHYGPLSHQLSTSNQLYSAQNSNYLGSSPPTHHSTHPCQWSFKSHSSSGHESSYRAPFFSHQKRKSIAKNTKYPQSYPRTFKFKKLKTQNPKVCSGVIANTSEDYITISHQPLTTQNVTHKLQTDIHNSESSHIGLQAQLNVKKENEDVNVNVNVEVDHREELWEWEFNAIFREPSAIETVELAQPLAAGFKSTPVPLTQPWSLLVPSISRYARKDNAKEFARSIRCSPQWSYLQEDPAFTDIKLDSPLISINEILAWIAMRREVDINFQNTYKNSYSKTLSPKRVRPYESEKHNQHDVDIQNKVDTQCIIEEPSKKKRKLISLETQDILDSLNTNSLLPVCCLEDNPYKEKNLDEDMKKTQKSKTTFLSRDTSEKEQHTCELTVFAAYRSVFKIFTLSHFPSRLTTFYSRRW